MADTQQIPIRDMAQHLDAGDAEALLDWVPGPVRLAGRWWAVPTGSDRYLPVKDPVAVTTLDQGWARLTAHREHILAQVGTRRQ